MKGGELYLEKMELLNASGRQSQPTSAEESDVFPPINVPPLSSETQNINVSVDVSEEDAAGASLSW